MSPYYGRFNYAICRRISRPAADSISSNGSDTRDQFQAIDNMSDKEFNEAQNELQNYIATLRMLNIDVIELCPDDALKYESIFIGDTAVIINGLILLCRPINRLKEIDDIKQIKRELDLPIIEIKDERAYLSGGDVLWTGREIFVGLSSETNEAGARAVAAAFPEYPVTPVQVPRKNNLRLKSHITMAGPDILCVSKSQETQEMLRRMEREASHQYKLITVDDDQAANVQYINGTLLHRNDLPRSFAIFQDRIDYSRVPVKISALTKNYPYQGLNSLCLLIRKSNRIQRLNRAFKSPNIARILHLDNSYSNLSSVCPPLCMVNNRQLEKKDI